jgi:hypothetical protein
MAETLLVKQIAELNHMLKTHQHGSDEKLPKGGSGRAEVRPNQVLINSIDRENKYCVCRAK